MSDKPLSPSKVQIKFRKMPRAERLGMTKEEVDRYRDLRDGRVKAKVKPDRDRSFNWSQTHYQRGMK